MSRLAVSVVLVGVVAAACGSDNSGGSAGTTAAGAATTAAGGAATTAAGGAATTAGGGAATTAGGAAQPASGDPIKVGFINQEAGAVGTFPEIGIAMQAVVDHINEDLGGIDGHPIELAKCITEGTPESTQKCAQEMVAEKPLFVATGIDFNGITSYPILKEAGVFAVGMLPLSTQESSAENVYFTNAGNASTTIGEAAYTTEKLPDVKRATIVANDNQAAQAALPFLQKPLEGAGIEVSVVSIPDAQTDYLGPWTQIEATNPDAIYVNVSPPGCISLAKVAAEQGNKVPIISQLTCYNKTMKEQIGDALVGWHIGLLTLDPEGDSPDAKEFRDAMTKHVGDSADFIGFSPVIFQLMMTVYNNVLKPIGYDGLLGSSGGFNGTAVQEKMGDPAGGQLFLGEKYKCGDPPFTAVCDYHSGWYIVGPAPDLALQDQLDGKLIDTRDLVTKYLG